MHYMKVIATLKNGWKACVWNPEIIWNLVLSIKSPSTYSHSVWSTEKYSPQKQFEIQKGNTILSKNWISPIIPDAQVFNGNWSTLESRNHGNKPAGNTSAPVDPYSFPA